MRLAFAVLLLVMPGCMEAYDELGDSGGEGCEQRNHAIGPFVLGPTDTSRSWLLDFDAEDLEDGEPMTLITLRAFVTGANGPLRFFASGPEERLGNLTGTGTQADPWLAQVPNPEYGRYEWGVQAEALATAASLSFSVQLQHGENPGLCDGPASAA